MRPFQRALGAAPLSLPLPEPDEYLLLQTVVVHRSAKAFYARSIDGEKVSALDLLLPDVGELCGGSLREHRPEVLEQRLDTHL